MKKLSLLLLGCSIATGAQALEFVGMAAALAAPVIFGLSKDGYKYFKATRNLEKNVDDVLNSKFIKRCEPLVTSENIPLSIEEDSNKHYFGISNCLFGISEEHNTEAKQRMKKDLKAVTTASTKEYFLKKYFSKNYVYHPAYYGEKDKEEYSKKFNVNTDYMPSSLFNTISLQAFIEVIRKIEKLNE
jgi:hypothetical protein